MKPAIRAFFLVVCVTVPLQAQAEDLPGGYQAVAGQSTYQTNATKGTLTAQDAVTIGQWSRGFNVASGKTFEANLPSANAVHLSRDITANPSQIFGALNVPRGKFFLVNQNGITFAPGSSVNAAGLVASSLDISNGDFLSGNYRFVRNGGRPPAAVVNAGTMNIGAGGLALLGGSARNGGTITAQASSVALASGDAMTLSFDPDGFVSVLVDEAVQARVLGTTDATRNTGTIRANGGRVTLTAEAAADLFTRLVNNEGVIEARSVGTRDGLIVLSSQSPGLVRHAGSVDATGPGGRVEFSGTRLDVDSPLDGAYSFLGRGDALRFRRTVGGITPLSNFQVLAGTIEAGAVTTTGTLSLRNVSRYFDDHYSSGFETVLSGNLSGAYVSVQGATRLAAPVSIRAYAPGEDEGFLTLGYSETYQAARLTGPFALTLASDGGIRFEAAARPGTYYEIGSAASRVSSVTITEAQSATLFGVRSFTNSLNFTANGLSVVGNYDTVGPLSLRATELEAAGRFNTHGGALSLEAASIRMGGEFRTLGGSITVNGPTTFETAYPDAFSVIVPSLDSGGGNIYFAAPVRLASSATVRSGGGSLRFNSTLDGTVSGREDLTLDAGTGNLTMMGRVGYNPATTQGTRLGKLTIQNARDVWAGDIVTAASILQRDASGTSTFRGMLRSNTAAGINLTGNNFSLNGATATNGGTITVNHRGTVTRTGSYSPTPTVKKI